MWTSTLLKKRFTDFFTKHEHVSLPSSSVLPANDPSLLFTNSGMVQFKKIFLGEKPSHKRVCTIQRCIRAGGKHNDLDDVGKDNYHHTFFEMLGNWSFGDYFKEEAIKFAYEFLIEDLGLKKENIYVTIYEDMDKESRSIWKKYVDESRIIPSSAKDNFWEMGEYGPCGPCTEIHYDRIGNRDASSLVNQDDPSVIEIWNIVFMEYSRTPKGLVELETKHIDTGIGFERLLSILMDVKSNYKIDSFSSIIEFIEQNCEFKYTDSENVAECISDMAFRVLADHSRTIAVCLNDGLVFSNEGVGYALRRILRRAVRYAHDILKLKQGVLSQIVAHAAAFMDLKINAQLVDAEENLFVKTLAKGIARFNKMAENREVISSEEVFLLYDTYGFPIDLTELMAKEKGLGVDLSNIDSLKLEAQAKSRTAKAVISVSFDFEKTDDSFKYTHNSILGNLKAVIHNNQFVTISEAQEIRDKISLVFDKTCFYGEKGGQVGDSGKIEFVDENEEVVGTFVVEDTQIVRGYVLHTGIISGTIKEAAILTFNETKRERTRANHSTCHILYYFLRKIFPTVQRGSLVDSEKCRFDFEGNRMTEEMLLKLENDINAFVSSNAEGTVRILSEEDVKNDSELQLGDEDYSGGIRLIEMKNDTDTIKDLCSGTHVKNTSEIKKVRLISETGVQASIRRIVAVSREKAEEIDRNVSALKEQLVSGRTVTYDCMLPLLEKKDIDMMNKTNQKAIQKRFTQYLNECKEVLSTSFISNDLSKISLSGTDRPGLIYFNAEKACDFTKKDVSKLVSTISTMLVENEKLGFITAETDDEIFLGIVYKNHEELIESLISKLRTNNLRISKGVLQGSVPMEGRTVSDIVDVLKREIAF
ncbi:alanyl-tRNA synthetase [Enteropsectra breve]|nr:alanyl-tRNA synthetase [Enteropsectra breve]